MSSTARSAVCCLAVTLSVSTASRATPAAPERVSGRVTHVTLYRGQARVTRTIADAVVTLAKEAKDLNHQLALLQRRRGELTSVASRTVREALLFLDKRGEGPDSVRLSYLVGKCEWSPAYTFRAGGDRKQIRVECNGLIQQMSGEDWDGVQLTLST